MLHFPKCFQQYSKFNLSCSWFFLMLSKNRNSKWCHDLKIAFWVSCSESNCAHLVPLDKDIVLSWMAHFRVHKLSTFSASFSAQKITFLSVLTYSIWQFLAAGYTPELFFSPKDWATMWRMGYTQQWVVYGCILCYMELILVMLYNYILSISVLVIFGKLLWELWPLSYCKYLDRGIQCCTYF